MALFDVYFKTTYPMIVCVEAENEEEAEAIVREDDGTILDEETLINKFIESVRYNGYFTVDRVEKVDD